MSPDRSTGLSEADYKLSLLATVDREACEALKEGALKRLPVSAEQVGMIVALYRKVVAAASPVSVEGEDERGKNHAIHQGRRRDDPPWYCECGVALSDRSSALAHIEGLFTDAWDRLAASPSSPTGKDKR